MLSVKGDEHRYPDIGELTYWRNERPTARTEKATRSSLVPYGRGGISSAYLTHPKSPRLKLLLF
jgi:hypothetical protein